MTELDEKSFELGEKNIEQADLSDLRLQLNASQQTIATLELKVRQKEEVIIKTQADTAKQVQGYKAEIRSLKEQVIEAASLLNDSSNSQLEEALRFAESKENIASNKLQEMEENEKKTMKTLQEYEAKISNHVIEHQKLSDLHETVKVNLATLELAFHDVIQKYERAKGVIEGYKANEEVFKQNIDTLEKSLKLEVQRYESLKAHAKTQIEKANKENNMLRSSSEKIEIKHNAIVKRLEIKIAALEVSLDQKIKECSELAALCDEVTGKRV